MRSSAAALALILCVLVGASAQGQEPKRWIDYRNDKWQFCAAYPQGWDAQELFFGDVLRATAKRSEIGDATVTLGAFSNHHGEGAGPVKPLDEVAEDAEDYLLDTMVKDLQSRNEHLQVAGSDALVTRREYVEDRVRFISKEVRVRRADGAVIELVLRATNDQFVEFEPSFDAMVQQQFKPSCTKVAN